MSELGLTESKVLNSLEGKMTSREISTKTGISPEVLRTCLVRLQKGKYIVNYVKNMEVYYYRAKAPEKNNGENLKVSPEEVADLPPELKSQLSKSAQGNVRFNRTVKTMLNTPPSPRKTQPEMIIEALRKAGEGGMPVGTLSKETGIKNGSAAAVCSTLRRKGKIVSEIEFGRLIHYLPEFRPDLRDKKPPPPMKKKATVLLFSQKTLRQKTTWSAFPKAKMLPMSPREFPGVAIQYPNNEVKIRLVIHGSTFEAEGPAPLVNEWMNAFLQTMEKRQ